MDNAERARQLAPSPLGWLPGDPLPPGRRGKSPRFLQPSDCRSGSLGSPTERWRLIVRGRVQGVGYRAACCGKAGELGLGGWVRNRSDGSVEVQAEGAVQQLGELRLWCERGPAAAAVSAVSLTQIGVTGDDWFEVRR
jgi:acylphosphatase